MISIGMLLIPAVAAQGPIIRTVTPTTLSAKVRLDESQYEMQAMRDAELMPIFDNTKDDDTQLCAKETCGEWSCKKFCYCFDYVPTLEKFFEDNPKLQQAWCPDDGSNSCDCGEFDQNNNGILDFADKDDNAILDEVDLIMKENNCCTVCNVGKACGDRCVEPTYTGKCTKGCACQKQTMIEEFKEMLELSISEKRATEAAKKKSVLEDEISDVQQEAVSFSHVHNGKCQPAKDGVVYDVAPKIFEGVTDARDAPAAVWKCRKDPGCSAVAFVDGRWQGCTKTCEGGACLEFDDIADALVLTSDVKSKDVKE